MSFQSLFARVSENIGSATDGSRVWPVNRKDDKKMGIRIDWGQKYQDATTKKWFRNMVLQLNSEAENAGLKAAVGKNGSHAQRAIAAVPLNDDGTALDPSIDEEVLDDQFIGKLNSGF